MEHTFGIWSDVQCYTARIQELCNTVKIKVEEKTGKNYDEYKAVFYRTKNMLVQHYIIKVYVGDNYLHLWIADASGSVGVQSIDVLGVQTDHKWDDPLKPFDANN